MFPRVYIFCVALGVAVLVAVTLIPVPPFKANAARISCAGRQLLFESKQKQLSMDTPYDVVAFGNSRILGVGEQELDMPDVHYFNMAVGGTSFRQSVAMLEMVARQGKAPKVAILSFDHVSLIYAQLPYEYPLPPERWRLLAGDLGGLFSGPYVVGPDWRKFRQRLFVDEPGFLARTLNFYILRDRLLMWLGDRDTPCGIAWRPDGSRQSSAVPSADLYGAPVPHPPLYDDRYPLLEHDLDRLAAIQQAAGTRIVVYESPVYPPFADYANPRLNPEMSGQRERLFASCKARGLDCHPSPLIPGTAEDGFWPDAVHAPAKPLGRWVAQLVRPYFKSN